MILRMCPARKMVRMDCLIISLMALNIICPSWALRRHRLRILKVTLWAAPISPASGSLKESPKARMTLATTLSATNFGDYIVFSNIAPAGGAISVTAETDTSSFRSPLNGIELVPATGPVLVFTSWAIPRIPSPSRRFRPLSNSSRRPVIRSGAHQPHGDHDFVRDFGFRMHPAAVVSVV